MSLLPEAENNVVGRKLVPGNTYVIIPETPGFVWSCGGGMGNVTPGAHDPSFPGEGVTVVWCAVLKVGEQNQAGFGIKGG